MIQECSGASVDPTIAYGCPDCEALVDQRGGSLECPACGHSWPMVDGTPHFVTDFPYWGEMPQDKIRRLNSLMKAGENWKQLLRESEDPDVRRASTMMMNLERANWHYLTDVSADASVLDVGAGTGTTSDALARRFREVVALEPVLERIEFMRHRFSQEKLHNVKVVRGSVWTLPFAPGSFDLVAMNGVLEWVPTGRTEDPRQLQEMALKRMFRLLRPGGQLYVGIENRYCPGYFVGHRDPHAGIPFVTVLPRPLAHWYARRQGRPGYRNYLYSSGGYRKLLTRAGFTKIDIYLALPSYNFPRFLIPLEGDGFSFYSRNFDNVRPEGIRKKIHSLLVSLGVMKYWEYSFVMIAGKQ